MLELLNDTESPDAIDVRLNGFRFWYLIDGGRWLPQVRGGAGDDDDPDDDDDDPENDPDDKDKDDKPKFTQKDLNDIGVKEARKGRRAAVKDLMEKFGFKSEAEAEQFIKDAREKASGDDDDAAERQRKLDERERAAEEREAKARAKERAADLRSALIEAGAPRDKDKLADLVNMVRLEDDADEDDIADAVEELAKRWPNLFGDTDDDDDDDRTPDTRHRSGGGRRKRPKTDGVEDRVKARFADRHPHAQT